MTSTMTFLEIEKKGIPRMGLRIPSQIANKREDQNKKKKKREREKSTSVWLSNCTGVTFAAQLAIP